MSNDLGEPGTPSAARVRAAGWRDPRLWIGIALVAVSVVVGVRVVGGADDTIEVWATTTMLAPGQRITRQDLETVRIRFRDDGDLDRYLPADEALPAEATALRTVGAGELLPGAAVGEPSEQLTEVALNLPANQVPGTVDTGATIDVWVTPEPGTTKLSGSRLVLDDVQVTQAPEPRDSFAPNSDRQLVIGVDEDQARRIGTVLAAAGADRLGITREG